MSEEERRKTVTIRGVDEEIYGKLVATAKSLGKNIGEAATEAFKLFIITVEAASKSIDNAVTKSKKVGNAFMEGVKEEMAITVGNIDELTITKKDLEAAGRKVIFKNVKRLVFTEDVDSNTFNKYVDSIIMCDELVLPSSIPRLSVLSKCRYVKKVSSG
ncbi:MAG: hypothetical protein J7L98_06060 [Candidatus Verstraetearchaeota archaeon]|nr:hypothetical protein [Candidatus Verstraetearchaeota archaeon]